MRKSDLMYTAGHDQYHNFVVVQKLKARIGNNGKTSKFMIEKGKQIGNPIFKPTPPKHINTH